MIALVVLRLLGLGGPLLEDGELHALALGERHLQKGNSRERLGRVGSTLSTDETGPQYLAR